jgi:signal transduction histidine kinase
MRVRLAPWEVATSELVALPADRRGARALSRFADQEHSTGFWAGLWVAAAAAELGVFLPVIFAHGAPHPGYDIAFRLVGGSFAACGLIAWRRRPDSHSGLLMTAAGFGFFFSPLLDQFDAPVAQTAATYLTDVWTIPFIALVLTFLTAGRLRTPVDRALVAVFVTSLLGLQLVWMLFLDDPGNVVALLPDAGIASAVDTTQRVLTLLGCAGTVGAIAWRWRAASPPRRRALLPSVAGAVALALFASLLINDLIGTGRRSDLHLWIAIASLALVPAAFLAGLLRSRIARAGLADLFRGMRTMRGPELEAALARAMGDPQLVVAHRGVRSGEYIGARGAPVALPAAGTGRRVAPVESNGREVAVLVYDGSLDDDPALVEAVAAAAGIALENERLHAESDAQLAELRASRERLVTAGDDERRRLERNLHDGAQQRLVALGLQLRLLQGRIREDPTTAEQLATTAGDELARSLEELRELARGIHPAVLDHGLEPALDSLASRSPVPTDLVYEAAGPLPAAVELAAYFVVSEALTNVAKYAQARSAIVRVARDGGRLLVEVADDGVGGADAKDGSGLRGLADRVEALGGRLQLSSPRGAGTVLSAEIPCGS